MSLCSQDSIIEARRLGGIAGWAGPRVAGGARCCRSSRVTWARTPRSGQSNGRSRSRRSSDTSIFNQIESIFELPGGTFDVELPPSQRPKDNSFILRSAKWPSFRMRNVAHLLEGQIKGEGVEIWLSATATRFKLAENGRLASVIATSPSRNEIEVEAKLVVIAAGAIESTRLLLLLDAQQGERVFGAYRQLGRYFFDHLSNSTGTIVPRKLKALNETFGFRFVHSGMRDLRIEPSPKLRAMRALPELSHISGQLLRLIPVLRPCAGFTAICKTCRPSIGATPCCSVATSAGCPMLCGGGSSRGACSIRGARDST